MARGIVGALLISVLISGSAEASGWVRRPKDPSAEDVEQLRQQLQALRAGSQQGTLVGGAVSLDLTQPGNLSAWAFATKNARDLRKKILDGCYLVLSGNFSEWSWPGILPKGPTTDWHVLGLPSCAGPAGAVKHITTADELDTKWASSIENDVRLIAEARHPEQSILLASTGERLSDDELKSVRKDAADFITEESKSRPFRALLPAYDDYSSKAFFGADQLQFLHEVRASGWGDRVSVTTELVADRIGYGRLALSGAFAGSNSNGSTPALSQGDDAKRENVQKFFDNGGDIALTYEVPVLFAEKRSNTAGFALVSLLPRLVTTAPGLGSVINDASFAFEPGARLYVQLQGFENSMGIYADTWVGWAIGMGPHFSQYVDERHFFVGTVVAGLRLFDRFNVGAGYIYAGPLQGRNGITLNVTAVTGGGN